MLLLAQRALASPKLFVVLAKCLLGPMFFGRPEEETIQEEQMIYIACLYGNLGGAHLSFTFENWLQQSALLGIDLALQCAKERSR